LDINFSQRSNLEMSTFCKRTRSLTLREAIVTRLFPNRPSRTDEQGFSLIELMIASFILGIGVLSVTTMIGTSISRNLSSKNDTVGMAAAELVMEQLKTTSFSSLTVGGSTLQSDGRLLFENPSDGSAYATVNNYFRDIPLANSDEAGQTAPIRSAEHFRGVQRRQANRLLRITIGARRLPSNQRLPPFNWCLPRRSSH
jgi:prepilin-type N-terminal cleavage/methylation domain-containing protein